MGRSKEECLAVCDAAHHVLQCQYTPLDITHRSSNQQLLTGEGGELDSAGEEEGIIDSDEDTLELDLAPRKLPRMKRLVSHMCVCVCTCVSTCYTL